MRSLSAASSIRNDQGWTTPDRPDTETRTTAAHPSEFFVELALNLYTVLCRRTSLYQKLNFS